MSKTKKATKPEPTIYNARDEALHALGEAQKALDEAGEVFDRALSAFNAANSPVVIDMQNLEQKKKRVGWKTR